MLTTPFLCLKWELFLKNPKILVPTYASVIRCRVKAKALNERIGVAAVKRLAGPLGFEPRTSGSAGRCHNPY